MLLNLPTPMPWTLNTDALPARPAPLASGTSAAYVQHGMVRMAWWYEWQVHVMAVRLSNLLMAILVFLSQGVWQRQAASLHAPVTLRLWL